MVTGRRRHAGSVPTLSSREVLGRRLARHFLTRPAPRASLVDVVGAVCGIHAQVMSCAEISLGLRVAGATRSDLAHELWERRSLVKTYGLRGTIHILPADELGMWLSALRANPGPRAESQTERIGLDVQQLSSIVDAIGASLAGGRLTRDDLGQEVARRVGRWALADGIPAFGGHFPRWMPGIGTAAVEGIVCFGPNVGNRVTYARVDDWLGHSVSVGDDGALVHVLRRYLGAFGPATAAEFAQWFYMAPAPARRLVESIADELVEVELDGRRCWMLRSDLDEGAPSPESVLLLAQFDVYQVGSHPRDLVAPPSVAVRARSSRGDARIGRASLVGPLPVLVVDGVIAGIWTRQRRKGRMEIRVDAFEALSASQRRALRGSAERVGSIVEAPVDLTLEAVPVRPHL